MVAHAREPYMTAQEYLLRERDAETRSEWFDGVLVAISGASPDHNTITFNLAGELQARLKGTPCRGYVSDMRVHAAECSRFFYPDLVVVCGDPSYLEIAGVLSLQNPTLIIEVLSESTERLDRGDKLLCYQTLPSLLAYILIAQDRPLAQTYIRESGDDWRYAVYHGMNAIVPIPSIGAELAMEDIYARIEFSTNA